MPSVRKLIAVFEDSRRLVDNPDNNFDWSSWIDVPHALAEIDGILVGLRANELPSNMSILFAPTGPLQDVAVSSGWGEEFIDLANAFDSAMATDNVCHCNETPSSTLEIVTEFSMDRFFGQGGIRKCQDCGQYWIHYLYENEAFTASGRWFLAMVSEEHIPLINKENAKWEIEHSPWYFYGGSYFGNRSGRSNGAIRFRR